MVLGMSIATFTLLHVVISLVGIVSGLVAMVGLLTSRAMPAITALFLLTTILTSVTGFLFPFTDLLPSHIVGLTSLVLLAVAVFALYVRHTSGIWRPIYVVTAMLALYLNVFVLIIQSFIKLAPLKALAPTQTEPPFLVVQGVVLALFCVLTLVAAIRYRPGPMSLA